MKWILSVFFLLLPITVYASEPYISKDGLYKSSIIHETKMDLREDYLGAKRQDKILVIVSEQIGCVYCKLMHTEVLIDPKIKSIIDNSFHLVQFNLGGIKPLTDFQGNEIQERVFQNKLGVFGTPTFIFFSTEESISDISDILEQEILRVPGSMSVKDFEKILLSL